MITDLLEQKPPVSWSKPVETRPDEKNDSWFNRGVVLANLGQFEEAIICFDKVLEIKQDDHNAWYNRGIVLANLGKFEEAIAAYKKAINIKPDDHKSWNNKGCTLYFLGRFKEAIAAYKEAINIKPDYHEAWYNKGVVLAELERFEEAISAYEEAIKIKPDDHQTWSNKGVVLAELERFEEAISAWDTALKIKPEDYQIWSNKGRALTELRKYAEAIPSYDKALENKPDSAEAYYIKAWCYTMLKNVDQAIDNLQKAINLSPEKFIETAKTDSDFDILREDKRFQALIAGEIRILRHNVSWKEFENIIAEMGDDRASRVAYDQGTLEIFMPSKTHEYYKEIFGDLIKYLADELDIDYVVLGSTLWKREELLKGAEPDNCFYIKNEALIRDKILDIELSKDPPPDLILEVDYTSPSLDKLPIYAGLGVPEVWLYDMRYFYIYQLQDGEYKDTETSLAFPNFPVKEIPNFIEQNISASRTVLRKNFRNWVNSVNV